MCPKLAGILAALWNRTPGAKWRGYPGARDSLLGGCLPQTPDKINIKYRPTGPLKTHLKTGSSGTSEVEVTRAGGVGVQSLACTPTVAPVFFASEHVISGQTGRPPQRTLCPPHASGSLPPPYGLRRMPASASNNLTRGASSSSRVESI